MYTKLWAPEEAYSIRAFSKGIKKHRLLYHGVIGVHVGQAGVGTGAAMWDLLRREHGIMDSGYLLNGGGHGGAATTPNTMFQSLTPERYFQKAVFLDTDPCTMDMVVSSPQSRLLQKGAVVSGTKPANGLYSSAKHGNGPEMGPTVTENIRKLTEKGDKGPEGFLFTHSMAGGTGSGLTADMLGRLKEEYPKSHQVQLAVYPDQELKNKGSLFGFYNAGLMLKDTMDDLRTVILVDNPALFGLLNSCSLQSINGISYWSANQLLAHVASALTACTRFYGTSPLMLGDLENFLVPTRLLRFSTAAITPISQGCYCHGVQPEKMETRDVTTGCFNPKAQLNSAAGTRGEPAISTSLVYRGYNDKDEINRSIHQAVNQYDVRFGEGIRKGFKVGLAETAPTLVPFEEHKKASTSAALFNNTTALAKPFSFLKEVIQAMVNRRTNLHYYLQSGEELADFSEALDSLRSLVNEYKSYRGRPNDPNKVGEKKRNWNYTHGIQGDVFNCNNVSELRQYACKCNRCYGGSPCPTR